MLIPFAGICRDLNHAVLPRHFDINAVIQLQDGTRQRFDEVFTVVSPGATGPTPIGVGIVVNGIVVGLAKHGGSIRL